MEGLSVAFANLMVYLHLSKSRNVSQSILRELGSLLIKFNETFDGVLLAYDVNILDKHAKILSDVHLYFGLRLKSNLLLFSPKPDMLLEGKVAKLSQESIHVIVLGFSSTIITAENIREEFKYRTVTLFYLVFNFFIFFVCWVCVCGKRLHVLLRTICHQISQSTCHKGWNQDPIFSQEEILHIIGSLISAHTGIIRWLDRHLEEDSKFDRSSMKSRDREWLGDKTVDEGATLMSYDNHIKIGEGGVIERYSGIERKALDSYVEILSQFLLQMEGLSLTDANLVMYLHLSKSRNVSQSILHELGSLLFNLAENLTSDDEANDTVALFKQMEKFNETFDGVLLAYDVNILDKQAKILSGVHLYFSLRLKANLLLFSPKPDMLLVDITLPGKVVKLSQESIHVIVLDFSSAIITAENIRGEFKYRFVTFFYLVLYFFIFFVCWVCVYGKRLHKYKEELFSSKSHKRHVIKVETLQMEGLSVADANLVMYLHPSKSRNVSQSILRELGSLLFKFNETFDGVLLAYDVNILDKQAKILSGVHPYFGLRLKANLLLFSPKPDMLLEGKVVKLSQESIHVIVLGFSSAIITAENIRGEFKYRTKDKEELFASKSHKRHVIKVETMIRFLVKSFDEEILHIIGSLISAHTGSIRWLDRHLEEDSEFDWSSMKSRDREWLGDKTVDEGATPMSYDNHIKIGEGGVVVFESKISLREMLCSNKIYVFDKWARRPA
ncbi:hypothetical protein CXB51_017617 [Gossypium anomalum]|uniref:DNA-directed RNA polymerase subunit n=1 Tax=Gossypium anomalum TaxID=47600 RepID=A0A8J5YX15_9ROSI|nr:hypothetical protein CXB51_017617 [Gossypium anomalum]